MGAVRVAGVIAALFGQASGFVAHGVDGFDQASQGRLRGYPLIWSRRKRASKCVSGGSVGVLRVHAQAPERGDADSGVVWESLEQGRIRAAIVRARQSERIFHEASVPLLGSAERLSALAYSKML